MVPGLRRYDAWIPCRASLARNDERAITIQILKPGMPALKGYDRKGFVTHCARRLFAAASAPALRNLHRFFL